jgi:TonB family protein
MSAPASLHYLEAMPMKIPTHSNAIVCIFLSLVWNGPTAWAQSTDSDWKERAQRAADAPFRWILLHSTKKPAKPAGKGGADTSPTERPSTTGAGNADKGAAPGRPASPAQPASGATPPGGQQNSTPAPEAPVDTGSGVLAPSAASAAQAYSAAASAAPATAQAPAPVALKALKRSPPDIPAHVLESVGDGLVTVRFTVHTNGSVAQVAVVKSTHPRLDRYVLSAVSAWLFAPIATATEAQAQFVFKPD